MHLRYFRLRIVCICVLTAVTCTLVCADDSKSSDVAVHYQLTGRVVDSTNQKLGVSDAIVYVESDVINKHNSSNDVVKASIKDSKLYEVPNCLISGQTLQVICKDNNSYLLNFTDSGTEKFAAYLKKPNDPWEYKPKNATGFVRVTCDSDLKVSHSFFVVPNTCYSSTQEDGSFKLTFKGEPGDFVLKVVKKEYKHFSLSCIAKQGEKSIVINDSGNNVIKLDATKKKN